ncbi:glycogen synthase GlgA [Bacillus sp. PS06]|uniref:glycogen synthase GlgA n=1 Tax=Bacillus sp. PS06 TaxID=2764176 RepID=UPI00177EC8BB|nr:glycogen synthase GlgA [Bacillus sp. PS06]MBD8068543.1 glycogen synthase GlgA [Bacillus sp. PS06]
MNVLFVASECVPFIKSGGLADVAGALPKELVRLGTNVEVILPKYGLIASTYRDQMEKIAEITVNVGWREQYCGIEKLVYKGITYYFIDNEYYFNRDSLYGHYDDAERFSFFCRAVLDAIPQLEQIPDVIHCHDWHTGMVNFLLHNEYKHDERYASIRSVFTIHNLQFQGIFPPSITHDLLGITDSYLNINQLEFYGNVNFMKAALVSSNVITTVSPTYRNEVQTEYFGEKLDGLLRARSSSLIGILNGIDDEEYNPATDDAIDYLYDANHIEGKYQNKQALQEYFGLPVNSDVPLISIVSRLTSQKGLDLVNRVLDELLYSEDIQFVVLGTGDSEYEHFFNYLQNKYTEKVRVYIGFSESMARKIYAGSDLFLMPSKFEPCGLGQLIAMRYGTIPIVRETGGLNDTVQSYNEFTNEGNGFSFTNYNAHDMMHTIKRAIHFYHKKECWNHIVNEAMTRDYSWAQSAFRYNQLYAGLATRSGVHVY